MCQFQPNQAVAQAGPSAEDGAEHDDPGHRALDEAYRRQSAHDLAGARAAFEAALHAGADAQVVQYELGQIARQQGDADGARDAFRAASTGPDAELAREAERALTAVSGDGPAAQTEPATQPAADADALLDQAYARKQKGDVAGARAAFEAAERAGADHQLIALELAYLAIDQHDVTSARREFTRAQNGPDAARREQAARELAALKGESPGHFWADLYGEAFGWKRVEGANQDADLVPTLRLRAYYQPFTSLDAHLYVFAQGTRDVASRTSGPGGLPLIYADNTALFGPGLLVRLWQRQLGLFAQIGPAIELVDSTRKRVQLDARVGAQLGLESSGCWPAAQRPRFRLSSCSELYAEVTYVNRFDNDVFGFARARTSLGFAVTGPVGWELTGELRGAKDKNDEYYNNFADVGLGPRVRLLAPFHLELMLAPHLGTYFGEHHLEPAPHPLHYVDLRAQLATYVEFGP
jgi:Tfp pilus assembly protein PilF